MAIIRELEPGDDLRDLVALSRAFFGEYATHHAFFAIGELQDSHILGFFTRSIESADKRTFIALVQGRIVGYITVAVRPQAPFYEVGRVGAISGLMVHEAHRRQGIAHQLFDRAVRFFADKGITYYTVYTAVANQAAIAFYERHGLAPLHVNMVGTVEPAPDADPHDSKPI